MFSANVIGIAPASRRCCFICLLQNLPSLAAGSSAVSTSAVEDAALLRSVVEFYYANFKQSPEALAYLESRGLNHPELIEHLKP
ncbi:hypothetical protein VRC34_12040 [Pseudomonas poae]